MLSVQLGAACDSRSHPRLPCNSRPAARSLRRAARGAAEGVDDWEPSTSSGEAGRRREESGGPSISGPCDLGQRLAGSRGDYVIQHRLGAGSSGVTYCATVAVVHANEGSGDSAALRVGDTVALKCVSLRGGGWRAVELYERESRALRAVQHPAVPAFLDAFQVDTAQNVLFVLVQRLAPGRSLQALCDAGWRPDEETVAKVAQSLLECLRYLHALRPPIIHRDIGPSNVMLDTETGAVSLIDFGSVAGLEQQGTVTGTYGYMASEQFRGQSVPASDLYSVGATLLFLLSGLAPSELPQRGLGVDWQGAVTVQHPRLRALLAMLMQVEPEARGDAPSALACLRGEAPLATRDVPALQRRRRAPAGTRVQLLRSGTDSISVTIPPAGIRQAAGQGAFAAAWLSFVGMWTFSAVTAGAPLLFTAFSAPFWLAGGKVARDAVATAAVATSLRIGRDEWRLSSAAGSLRVSEACGATRDLERVQARAAAAADEERELQVLELLEGVRAHTLALGLTPAESVWLAGELNAFLSDVQDE